MPVLVLVLALVLMLVLVLLSTACYSATHVVSEMCKVEMAHRYMWRPYLERARTSIWSQYVIFMMTDYAMVSARNLAGEGGRGRSTRIRFGSARGYAVRLALLSVFWTDWLHVLTLTRGSEVVVRVNGLLTFRVTRFERFTCDISNENQEVADGTSPHERRNSVGLSRYPICTMTYLALAFTYLDIFLECAHSGVADTASLAAVL